MKVSSILSAKSCFDISELEDNWRNCSECKKPLEIREVAKTLPSNLWKAPRPYYPVLIYAVTSKTTLNSMKVRHYRNKKYWPFKYLVTGAKGGGGGRGEGEEEGRGGGRARKGKGKRAYSPQSLSLFPFPPIRHFFLVTHKILLNNQIISHD